MKKVVKQSKTNIKKRKVVKKGLITILGLAGGKIDKEDGKLLAINFKTKHKYYFENSDIPNEPNYTNTLAFLIDNFGKDYKIVPLFTTEAKLVQSKILDETENKKEWIDKLFDEKYLIKDETISNSHIFKL